MMPDLNVYQVVYDADGEVVETKNMGEAADTQRVVSVLATSATDARKKAEVLIGQGR
jgi:hypothetical protein